MNVFSQPKYTKYICFDPCLVWGLIWNKSIGPTLVVLTYLIKKFNKPLDCLCSSKSSSNDLILPWTLRRRNMVWDLHVSDLRHGLQPFSSVHTPQWRLGSYSLIFEAAALFLLSLLLLVLDFFTLSTRTCLDFDCMPGKNKNRKGSRFKNFLD